MNPYDLVVPGLDLLDDNIHLGHENITLKFEVPRQSTEVDKSGNPIRVSDTVELKGRAKVDSNASRNEQTTGLDSNYILLRVNITTVDGEPSTTIPSNVLPSDIAIATYNDTESRSYTGQFKVRALPNYSIWKIHSKVGGILVGQFEITGSG